MMEQQTSLKRTQFAQNIRREQREQIKSRIRNLFIQQSAEDNIMNMNHSQHHQDSKYNYSTNGTSTSIIAGVQYNETEFQFLRTRCLSEKYSKQSIQQALAYILKCNPMGCLSIQKNLRFLFTISEKMQGNNLLSQFSINTAPKLCFKILQLVKQQINSNQQRTHQLGQLHVLKDCFDGLISLVSSFRCYRQLWIHISRVNNQDFSKYAFIAFQKQFAQDNDLTSDQIRFIRTALEGFWDQNQNRGTSFIAIIDKLFCQYYINDTDSCRLIDLLLQIIAQPQIKEKIQIILQNTNLFQNITEMLDKSSKSCHKNNFEIATKIAYFIAKIYSVDDQQLCIKIYQKNPMVLGSLRSWLPVPPKMMNLNLQAPCPQLTHSNHKCTVYIIFALSNIVVSVQKLLQTILVDSDIFRCLVILYMNKTLPIECREQISIFMYNVVNRCDIGNLRVALEFKLTQVIGQMIKEDNQFILTKCLKTIIIIKKILDENNVATQFDFVYNSKRFKVHLQNLGVIKLLDCFVTYPDEKIAKYAIDALQLLQ